MKRLKIRKAKISDIPRLIKLCYNVKEIRDYSGMKYDRKYFLSYLTVKNRVVCICEIDGKLAGAMNVEFNPGVYTFLNNIVVNKKFRGKGAGGALLKHLERESKKTHAKAVMFLVYGWNKNMRKIVEHYNYKHGKELYIYSKKL